MASIRTKLIIVILLLACIFCAGRSRSRLDTIRPDPDRFQELLYIPRGTALKLLSCGFESPLADLLWVKGLIYYSDNMRAAKKEHEHGIPTEDRTARHRYIYELYDVITDLNPRFSRAYFYGGLFLLSTGMEDRVIKGIAVLEKGVRTLSAEAEAGRPVKPDMRWKYQTSIADAWDNTLQTIYRRRGDDELARKAAIQGKHHFREAVKLPDCPPMIAAVVVNEEAQTALENGVEKQYDIMIATWKSLIGEFNAKESKELAEYASTRLAELEARRKVILMTRKTESVLTDAVRKFIAKNRRKPGSLNDLIRDGFLRDIPLQPLHMNELFGNLSDQPVILNDGQVRSVRLAKMEALLLQEFLQDKVAKFFKSRSVLPKNLQQLVNEKILDKIPVHPLAEFGYQLVYNPRNGVMSIKEPN